MAHLVGDHRRRQPAVGVKEARPSVAEELVAVGSPRGAGWRNCEVRAAQARAWHSCPSGRTSVLFSDAAGLRTGRTAASATNRRRFAFAEARPAERGGVGGADRFLHKVVLGEDASCHSGARRKARRRRLRLAREAGVAVVAPQQVRDAHLRGPQRRRHRHQRSRGFAAPRTVVIDSKHERVEAEAIAQWRRRRCLASAW